MMDANNAVEATGENVEEAVAAGLQELGVGPNDVLVEVLEEPSRGVFGIGARQARVRLKLLRPPTPPPPVEEETPVEDVNDMEFDDSDEDVIISEEESDGEIAEDGTIGKEVLTELLQKMDIHDFEIRIHKAEAAQPGEIAPWILDIDGRDMNLLIGRRGETLGALQYITRLITSRHLQRRANLVVDAGGYKSKRSKRLRQLALRMARQAVDQGRTMTLEPMPPNERRIIHLTLRNHDEVTTRSTGEGDSRKVTIVPK